MSFRDFGIVGKYHCGADKLSREIAEAAGQVFRVVEVAAIETGVGGRKSHIPWSNVFRLAMCDGAGCITLDNHPSSGEVLAGDLMCVGSALCRALRLNMLYWQIYPNGWRLQLCSRGIWQPERFESEPEEFPFSVPNRLLPSQVRASVDPAQRSVFAGKVSRAFDLEGARVTAVLDLSRPFLDVARRSDALSPRYARNDPRHVLDCLEYMGFHHPFKHELAACRFYDVFCGPSM